MFRTQLPPILAVWAGFLALAVCVSASPASLQMAPSRGVEVLPQNQVQAPPVFNPGQSVGIFVGIRNYDPGMTNVAEVRFAVDDAVDLAYLFALELQLVTPSRVWLLLSGKPEKTASQERLFYLIQQGAKISTASHSEILKEIDDRVEDAGVNGILIVTFASHGLRKDDTYYLLVADSLDNHVSETSVNVTKALSAISQAKAGMKLVLFDACRAEWPRGPNPDPKFAMSEEFARAIQMYKGVVSFSAASPGGSAYEDPKHQNGVFTAAVLDGLHCQAAPDFEGKVTVDQLGDFVNQRVMAWAQKHQPQDPVASQGIEKQVTVNAAKLPLAYCHPPPPPNPIPKPKPPSPAAGCDGAQLDSVEIFAGLAGGRMIEPPKGELNLQLSDLRNLENILGRAFLSRNGMRIEDCICHWEQLDSKSLSWIDLGAAGPACTFSLPVPRQPTDIALRLVMGEGPQIILHLQ